MTQKVNKEQFDFICEFYNYWLFENIEIHLEYEWLTFEEINNSDYNIINPNISHHLQLHWEQDGLPEFEDFLNNNMIYPDQIDNFEFFTDSQIIILRDLNRCFHNKALELKT